MKDFTIAPVEVPAYIIPYLIRECPGINLLRDGGFIKEIRIEKQSLFGMFLQRSLKLKPDYHTRFFQITLYTQKFGGQKICQADILEFKNNAEFSSDLGFEELEMFYRFLDNIFHQSFHFFMSGYCLQSCSRQRIKDGIRHFMDAYDLEEYGYNELQLRVRYLRYRREGSAGSFTSNKSFKFAKFFGN